MKQYKFRASSFGRLMGGVSKVGLTQRQQERLDELQSKDKRTEKQEQEMSELISKRDAPFELSKGAKTYIEEVVKRDVYGYTESFSSKETLKGINVEDDSIELYNEINFTSYEKSDMSLECDFCTGHPDIVDEANKKVIDIKSPWSKKTFPVFPEDGENSDYEWQVKMYLYMLGYNKGEIAYVLVDTPDELIPDWEAVDQHDMSDLDDRFKITIVNVELSDNDRETIEMVGNSAVAYANDYFSKLTNKNK